MVSSLRKDLSGDSIIAIKEGRHVKNCLFFSYNDAVEHISGYPSATWKVFALDDIANAISYCRGEHDDKGPSVAIGEEYGTTTLPSLPTDLPLCPNTQNAVVHGVAAAQSSPAEEGKHDKRNEAIEKLPSQSWLVMFEALKEHKEQTGSLDIDPSDASKNAIRQWVGEQRHQYKLFQSSSTSLSKKAFMTLTKIQMLTDLGFDFDKDKNKVGTISKSSQRVRKEQNNKRWEEMFASLQKYKQEHGTLDVKKDPENIGLYNWVQAQRLEYKKLADENDSKLSAKKIQRLLDLGFSFSKRSKYMKWNDRIEQLKEYKIKHGHLKIPINDPELGDFAARQRTEYAKYIEGRKDTVMTAAKEKQLRDLGFVFLNGKRISDEKRSRPKRTWEERFQELLEFKERHGHTIVPQHSETGLGEWVHVVG
jgi:hypothetical protein